MTAALALVGVLAVAGLVFTAAVLSIRARERDSVAERAHRLELERLRAKNVEQVDFAALAERVRHLEARGTSASLAAVARGR